MLEFDRPYAEVSCGAANMLVVHLSFCGTGPYLRRNRIHRCGWNVGSATGLTT